jgi:hypothetical protein
VEGELGRSGRFEIRRRIGAGGMGVVYEAFDRRLETEVAIKTLRHADPDTLLRLKEEFRGLQGIEHPNLVSLGELIQEEGTWLLTMELVRGVDFLAHVRGEQLDEARLRAALAQLAQGLAALHAAGKVHRDVKPSNVLVTAAGRVVLLDFGLATDTGADLQSTEVQVVGTAAYMAPEQAMVGRASAAADWYSFGVVLYEALTGRLPYTGATGVDILLKKQQYEPAPPRAIAPDVPRDLDRLCVDLLQPEPDVRPTGAAILERLGAASAVAPPPSATTSTMSQSPPFVGREAELALLRDAFADTADGSPVAVAVYGASGVGKSALLAQFTATLAAGSPDVVVVTGRCYERESVAYKALDGVVDALSRFLRRLPLVEATLLVPRHASLLPRVFPVLGRVEAIAQAPWPRQPITDPHELRAGAFAALRELCDRIAERYRLVVLIDDLQWADIDSFRLLADLLRPPDAPPLLLLLSARTDVADAGPFGGRIDLPGRVRHVTLDALAPGDAHKLARALLGRGAGARGASAAAIATEARGHPMFIDALCRRALAVQAADGDAGHVRLDDALWERATALAPAARAVLELIAVAASPLPRQVVREAARMDPAELTRQLSLLRFAGLLRTRGGRDDDAVEPYHDRVREAVLHHLSEERLRALHGRVAFALESSGAGAGRPELLVHHLERAGEAERAAGYAIEAARRASEALAFDRAVHLYRTAVRLGTRDRDQQRALRTSLALALSQAGHAAEAADEYLEAARGGDAATRRELTTRAAEQLLLGGHIERGLRVIEQVLADVGERLPRTPRRALASLAWRRARLRLRGLRFEARHEREIAASELARLDVYQAVGEGLAAVDTIRAADFQARGLLLALRLGEPKRIARALAMEALLLLTAGHKGRARAIRVLDAARAIAEQAKDPLLEAIVRAGDAWGCFAIGDFAGAAAGAAETVPRLRAQVVSSVFWVNNTRLFGLVAQRYASGHAEQLVRYQEYLRDAEARGDLYMATSLRRVCNFLWLVIDRPDEARLDLERTTWTPPGLGFHLQHWYEMWARAEIALYEDRAAAELASLRPGFRALGGSLLLRVEVMRVMALWLRGRLAIAAHDESPAPGLLREAAQCARRLARVRADYARGAALGLQAAVQHARGDAAAAAALLGRAAQAADAANAPLAAACARFQQGTLLGDGGHGLVAAAAAWMREQGIVDPARLAAVSAPGFRLSSRRPQLACFGPHRHDKLAP